jgi:hypothetical protein
MTRAGLLCGALVLAALAAGCGQNGGGDGSAPQGKGIDGTKYVLAEEPAGGKGVIETRKGVKDGDEVVLVGRIGGLSRPFVKGRAAFTVIDTSLEVCADGECCCLTDEKQFPTGSAKVQFVGDDGRTLQADAKEMLGLKERMVVVVKGKASRDAEGNLALVASGLHVRK